MIQAADNALRAPSGPSGGKRSGQQQHQEEEQVVGPVEDVLKTLPTIEVKVERLASIAPVSSTPVPPPPASLTSSSGVEESMTPTRSTPVASVAVT